MNIKNMKLGACIIVAALSIILMILSFFWGYILALALSVILFLFSLKLFSDVKNIDAEYFTEAKNFEKQKDIELKEFNKNKKSERKNIQIKYNIPKYFRL